MNDVIKTPEELDQLPDGTVIRDGDGDWFRRNPHWHKDPSPMWFPAWIVGNHMEQDFGVRAGEGFIVFPVEVMAVGDE